MKIPATADPYIVLCDEQIEQPEGESQVSLFPFAQLIEDMQRAICEQLDMPTRYSLCWTCRQYYAEFGDQDFHPFAFADKCAELGYRALLQDSVERGGPFDDSTSIAAAEHGQLGVLKLYVRLARQNRMRVPLEQVPALINSWARAAAKPGSLHVLEWVKVKQWRCVAALSDVAEAAMVQVPDTALAILAQLKLCERGENYSQNLEGALVTTAYRMGHLEAVRRLWQLGHQPELIYSWANPRIISWYFDTYPDQIEANLDHWLISGIEYNNVELIEIAIQHGAPITVDDFNPHQGPGRRLPEPRVLRYLHQKLGLHSAPFKKAVSIPNGISKDDLTWMLDQGYQFEERGFFPHYLNIELLPCLLQSGFSPTSEDVSLVADRYRFDLLDAFWQVKTDALLPDSSSIALFLRYHDGLRLARLTLKRHLRIIQWFLDKGYAYGAETKNYDEFICALLDRKPRLFRDYFEEIMALNMPLSTDTVTRIENFKN